MSETSLWIDRYARSGDGAADRPGAPPFARDELATVISPPLSAHLADPVDLCSPIALEVHGSLSKIEPEWRAFELL